MEIVSFRTVCFFHKRNTLRIYKHLLFRSRRIAPMFHPRDQTCRSLQKKHIYAWTFSKKKVGWAGTAPSALAGSSFLLISFLGIDVLIVLCGYILHYLLLLYVRGTLDVVCSTGSYSMLIDSNERTPAT